MLACADFSLSMGLSRWCSIESKSFKLAVEGRALVLRIIERCRGQVRSICLGRANLLWCLTTVEELVLGEGLMEFLASFHSGVPSSPCRAFQP